MRRFTGLPQLSSLVSDHSAVYSEYVRSTYDEDARMVGIDRQCHLHDTLYSDLEGGRGFVQSGYPPTFSSGQSTLIQYLIK